MYFHLVSFSGVYTLTILKSAGLEKNKKYSEIAALNGKIESELKFFIRPTLELFGAEIHFCLGRSTARAFHRNTIKAN